MQQCMKLSLTNRPIDFIVLIVHAHQAPLGAKMKTDVFKSLKRVNQLLNHIALSRPGGYGGAAAPVPIPNTAVKRPSANGTSSQDAGE